MQELLLAVNLDGNQKIVHIQHLKKLKFSAEKYKVLKISALKNTDTVCVDGNHLKLKMSLSIGSKGDKVSLCKSSVNTTVGSIIEISVRCKEANFGKNEISNLLLLYNSVFVPRLLQSHGQTFLRMTSSVQKIRNLILLEELWMYLDRHLLQFFTWNLAYPLPLSHINSKSDSKDTGYWIEIQMILEGIAGRTTG